MAEEVAHQLNCARLRPWKGRRDFPYPCSCGADPKVHNHGPEEGKGLACREYLTPEGVLRGSCLDDTELARAQGSYVKKMASPNLPTQFTSKGYSMLDEHHGLDVDPEHSHQHPTVPPVTSEKWDASVGEVRTTSATGGHKGVKEERFDLLPPEALAVVARHYAIGARKYGEHNWRKGHEWSKAYAAMQRHLHSWLGGEDLDPETNSPHLAAVVAHALTLLTFSQEHPEYDDRYKESK